MQCKPLHRQHTTTDFDACMQELNTLHVQRIELQDQVKRLQTCMTLLEEKRAWQDDQDLMALVQELQAVLQVGSCRAVHYMIVLQVVVLALHVCLLHVSLEMNLSLMQRIQAWLPGNEHSSTAGNALAGPAASDTGILCRDTLHNADQMEADLVDNCGLEGALDDSDFTLVCSKRSKKAARLGLLQKGRGPRHTRPEQLTAVALLCTFMYLCVIIYSCTVLL